MLSVEAWLGAYPLVSCLRPTYGTNDTPQMGASLSVPEIVVVDGKRRKLRVEVPVGSPETDCMIYLTCLKGRDHVALWNAETNGNVVAFDHEWRRSAFNGFECYVAGTNTSESVGDVVFRLDFVSEAGKTNSVSKCLTAVDYISEPISSLENTLDPERPYMNPCTIRSGRPETFWAILLPDDAPLSWLTWHAKVGNATFPEGNVGRRVLVDSTSSGLVLEVRINSYDDEPDPIEFKIDVVREDQ